MEDKLKLTSEENYEQFDTTEIIDSRKKSKNKNFFSMHPIIKYILATFSFLCLCLFLFNIIQKNSQKNFNSILESQTPQKKCEIGYKNENNKCILDYAIKGIYLTKNDNENINLIGFVPDFPVQMIIDGLSVESTKSYTFPKKGEHTVYINSNFTKLTSTKRLFYKIGSLTKIEFTPLFDTKNVKDMKSMFYECSELTSIDLSHFITKNVVNMELMFAGCRKLKHLDLSHFDTKNVNSMANMFEDCINLSELNLSNFDTREVKEMGFMFFECSSLTSLDISSFNTEKVTTMEYMFKGCSSLTSIDVSHFKTDNVISLSRMFEKNVLL